MYSAHRLLVLAALIFVASCVFAAESQEARDPILVDLKKKIEIELSKLDPKPTFEFPAGYSGNTLIVRYKTRDYLVHPIGMDGRISEKVVTREGPSHDGIHLRATVQPWNVANQAVVPQTLRDVYWTTYLQEYTVSKVDKKIYLGLSYNRLTDKKLIEGLKRVMESCGTPSSPGKRSEQTGESLEAPASRSP